MGAKASAIDDRPAGAKAPYDVQPLFFALREQYFTDCSGWPDNGKGWSRRVVQNLKYAQQDAQT
ncbi:hypothetical protein [Jeongeupia naejangsanensis]|uniref:Uncharacterized protein n=1 Tax=Jeongeupia naejangsanensis TaxID=613195 RepID=A0ABS2BMT8_9NEIS|nr:hypothetical protein [Jeongeupia naejangsanensis]MBM3116316.1 hypothetical protein [Jeongeupia naejangsanensis]